jgi:uncharacterized membrane protein YjgN (DUF898 family)
MRFVRSEAGNRSNRTSLRARAASAGWPRHGSTAYFVCAPYGARDCCAPKSWPVHAQFWYSLGAVSFEAARADLPAVETHRFEFTGRGAEYFRIWIVNLGLTVVTLGIYSAWAKVRTLRWMYRHTRVGGAAFDYTADPWKILRGRLIAVGLLVVSSMAGELTPILAGVVALALFAAGPWLIVLSRAFRLHHTVYRNVRFGFAREFGQAAKAYAIYPLLALISLGLLLPRVRLAQFRFMVDNARYGTTPFHLLARPLEFYRVYLLGALPILVGLAAWALLVSGDRPVAMPALTALGACFVVSYYVVSTATTNLVWRRTSAGELSFESTLTPLGLALIQATNTVAIILSAGLLLPWTRVRTARYRASCLRVIAPGGLDGFVAAREAAVSALGEEMGEAFDVDFDVGF